ncbi:MAG: nucleotidyltransferase domain-containing protein [Candidatus Binatia bacterium]
MRRRCLPSVEECYRGRSVRVFRLDREGVLSRLRERAQDVVRSDPRVREVRLFGSLARGDAKPGSDADLFIVVRDGAPPFLERIANLAKRFTGVGIGCDVIAYTESERAALAERHDRFARVVLEEGVVLAVAP